VRRQLWRIKRLLDSPAPEIGAPWQPQSPSAAVDEGGLEQDSGWTYRDQEEGGSCSSSSTNRMLSSGNKVSASVPDSDRGADTMGRACAASVGPAEQYPMKHSNRHASGPNLGQRVKAGKMSQACAFTLTNNATSRERSNVHSAAFNRIWLSDSKEDHPQVLSASTMSLDSKSDSIERPEHRAMKESISGLGSHGRVHTEQEDPSFSMMQRAEAQIPHGARGPCMPWTETGPRRMPWSPCPGQSHHFQVLPSNLPTFFDDDGDDDDDFRAPFDDHQRAASGHDVHRTASCTLPSLWREPKAARAGAGKAGGSIQGGATGSAVELPCIVFSAAGESRLRPLGRGIHRSRSVVDSEGLPAGADSAAESLSTMRQYAGSR
jgi:hypothetical protein